jgi:hypothetical protein
LPGHERFGERLHAYSFWAPDQARTLAKAADASNGNGVEIECIALAGESPGQGI